MGSSQGTEATTTAASQAPTPADHKERREHTSSAPSSPSSDEVNEVRFECLMNARYHSAREAYLDAVHRWLMFGVIALGTGAVLDPVAPLPFIRRLFGAGAALLGALDLTFDLSNRARAHALMKRRYFELLADVAERRKPIADARACLNRYSADEEPAYHALLCSCWNAAQEMVYGESAQFYDIPERDLRLQNIWRYEGKRYSLSQQSYAARPNIG